MKYSLPTPLPTLQVFLIVFFTTHERVQDARFQTAGATNHDANVTQNPGGGDELVNRSYRDRAADDLGHRDVTRNLSREL